MKNFIKTKIIKPHILVNVEHVGPIYAYIYSPTFAFKGESHKTWELIHVNDGEVVIETDDTSLILKEGQFYLHKPLDFHKIRANNVSCNVGIVNFDSKSNVLYNIADVIIDSYAYQINLFNQIIDEGVYLFDYKKESKTKTAKYANIQVLKNLIELLLIDIIRTTKKNNTSKTVLSINKEPTLVQNIKFFLLKNVNNKLTLQDIANEFNFSISYLCTVFKRSTGMSIINYFIMLKIEQAKKLIAENTKTIKEISNELNFDTLQYFSYRFKKATGFSPTQYAATIKSYDIMDRPQQYTSSLLLSNLMHNKDKNET